MNCPACGQKAKPNELICEKCGYIFSKSSNSKKAHQLAFSSYGKWCKNIALVLIIVGTIVSLIAGSLTAPKSAADKSDYTTSSESDYTTSSESNLYSAAPNSRSTIASNRNLSATIFGIFCSASVLFLLASWHYKHQETMIQQLNLMLSQRSEFKED